MAFTMPDEKNILFLSLICTFSHSLFPEIANHLRFPPNPNFFTAIWSFLIRPEIMQLCASRGAFLESLENFSGPKNHS